MIYYRDEQITLHLGDALEVARELPDTSVDCIVTSPPYYNLRDYAHPGQYGLEDTPGEYVQALRAVFAELRRVLADDGTLWLNLADSYRSVTHGDDKDEWKQLIGIPWLVATALYVDRWILRNDIIWHKPNTMPESVSDRLARRYEHVFLFAKSQHYFFDLDAIREPHSPISVDRAERGARKPYSVRGKSGQVKVPGAAPHSTISAGGRDINADGKNPGDVWSIPTQPFGGAHFAVMPLQLAQRCILAGCRPGGTVCDPFNGSGTTGAAAAKTGRRYIGVDINPDYLDLSLATRLNQAALDFEDA